jgi:hypothetical protein
MLVLSACADTAVSEVEASVRGYREGRYVATLTNSSDLDIYETCVVTGFADYGAIGSDRFLIRAAAHDATDHRATAELDDVVIDYDIDCVEELSVTPDIGRPVDTAEAARACGATAIFLRATNRSPDKGIEEATPSERIQLADRIVALARRSTDPALIAASERFRDNANTDNGFVYGEMFQDVDDACALLGYSAFRLPNRFRR